MSARYEITKKYAQAYAAAPKKGKSIILDQVVEITGWNRDHARQQLTARPRQAPGRATATACRRRRPHLDVLHLQHEREVYPHIWFPRS